MIYYIFLDVDGVLNDEVHIEKCYDMNGGHSMFMRYVPFDPKALFNLMTFDQSFLQYFFGSTRVSRFS